LLANGKVLVAGGLNTNGILSSAELYDPAAGTWTTAGDLGTTRLCHTATLLPNGKVLVSGGVFTTSVANGVTGSAELYDPAAGTWKPTCPLITARSGHIATLLANGRVLTIGGCGNTGVLSAVEVYDPLDGAWSPTAPMATGRAWHTATSLANGKVLVAGGYNYKDDLLSSAELYDPATGTWAATGPLNTTRMYHTATLLANGKVLVAGGEAGEGGIYRYILSSTELYDPANGRWTAAAPLSNIRYGHTATLLPNGKVLVAGGYDGGFLSGAELYNPALGTWTATGPLNTGRHRHTATLLPNGKVLVVGGWNANNLSSAELYDPATGTWTTTSPLNTVRNGHTATLLSNGKVLVAGGAGISNSSLSAELYDPATGTWTTTGPLNIARNGHTATLLPDGRVLIAAVDSLSSGYLSNAELYDPATGTWTVTGSLNTARKYHTAILLAGGTVLAAGGRNDTTYCSSAELYDAGLGFSASWQPQITTLTSPLSLGGTLTLTGSGFRGVSGGSSGNTQDSSADYPLLQLRSLETGQTMFLPSINWSTNSFTSAPLTGFPPGYAMATVFVNGIPSTGSLLNITVPVPTPITLTGSKTLTNGSFQFSFTNTPGALFGVLATTNLALPLSNWTLLGGVTEISPGQFQFTDAQATNSPQRFYRLRSP
jgi:N-acetylneuraminic acid mutarotase